ncbi:hypothetical protein [Hyalangium rubrum]|uniref:DUF5666 domain-containing protein n=1 Tax=Hyalangium rubrum TaxID=3103134 RepID=A0ABU5H966_9BACT|nr:hypothetical protein [Hyalangium sp. s54d21]MDY7230016.1 hypothetical protein [Hyalangium sp. s54d21]
MKKLIAALAICAGTVAFANETPDKVQKAQQEQAEKKRDATQVFTQKPGDSIKESKRDAEEGVDATRVGPAIGKAAKDVTGVQTESEGTFKVGQAFNMRGTLKDTTMEGVTIERPGLPAADLDIRDKTAVWLDGKKVKVNAIPEGAQVRAKFQLEGQDIVAVELRATSPKTKVPAAKPVDTDATGGSGTMMKDDLNKDAPDATEVGGDTVDRANEKRDDMNKSLK